MYKRIKGKKFSRKADQRRAFMRSMVANLILHEKIQTTKVRARQTANLTEKMITKAKAGDLASRRMLVAALPTEAVAKLMTIVAPRFKDRKGGYTRVIKLGQRIKDGAPMAIVELLDRPAAAPKATKSAPKAKKAKPAAKAKAEAKKAEVKA
jgi:large subunit ribosomal protein L17